MGRGRGVSPVGPGCSGHCAAGSWVLLRMEAVQHLWVTCPLILTGKSVSLHPDWLLCPTQGKSADYKADLKYPCTQKYQQRHTHQSTSLPTSLFIAAQAFSILISLLYNICCTQHRLIYLWQCRNLFLSLQASRSIHINVAKMTEWFVFCPGAAPLTSCYRNPAGEGVICVRSYSNSKPVAGSNTDEQSSGGRHAQPSKPTVPVRLCTSTQFCASQVHPFPSTSHKMSFQSCQI